MRAPLEERWLAKVSVPKDVLTDCWTWTGGRDTHGYGQISVSGRLVLAHRVAWMLCVGPLEPRSSVLHSCNRGGEGCVNPTHLRIGTQQDNVLDMVNAGHLGTAKVTKEDIPSIRSDPRPLRAIAEQHGLSRSAVSLIKNRKNWRHVQ